MPLDQDDIQNAMQTHPSAQAMQAPAMMPEGERVEALLGRPQPQNWLQRRGQVDPSGGLIGQMRTLGLRPYLHAARQEARAVPLGAGEESRRILGKIPGQGWQRYLSKSALTPQEQHIIQQFPRQARAGRGLTDIAGYTGATALAPESLMGQAIGSAIGGGAVAPKGHTLGGAAAGAALPFAPKIAGYGLKGLGKGLGFSAKTIAGLPKMDIISKSHLAKRLQAAYASVKDDSAELYNKVFKNTEDFRPQLHEETQSNIDGLKKIYTSPHDPVREAFDQYDKKPTLQKLHYLKSDIRIIKNKLDKKQWTPGGLSSTERGEQNLLGKTMNNMQTDLDSNFKLLPGNKKADYAKAQEHYENNVAPFKAYGSLRKLFAPKSKVRSTLYRDLSEHDEEAERLRGILGLNRLHMNLGRFLHRKYISGGGLALGAGLGMYARKKLAE